MSGDLKSLELSTVPMRSKSQAGKRLRFSASVLVSFLLVSSFAAWNLSTWPARIRYPGDEDYEGVVLATMIHMRQGVPVYAAGAASGFDGATYGPLFYLLGEHLINAEKPSYVPLRLLSVLAMLGCAAGCGVLAFLLTGSRFAASLSPITFLGYGVVSGCGIQALSDGVSLFLFFSGFLLAYRFRNSRGVLLAVPLMTLGFYYKPQYIAGPLAVLIFLFLEKRYRLAAQFTGLLAFSGIGMFALFQWGVFRGQAFWQHFLLYQSSALSWQLLGRGLFFIAVVFLLPGLFVLEYLRESSNRLLACYFSSALLLGLISFCKDGSGPHYFFELFLFVSVLIPVLLARRLKQHVFPLDFALLLGIMLLTGQWLKDPCPRKADVKRWESMQGFLRRSFPTHAVALGFYPGELLQAGLSTPFGSLFELAEFSRRGVVSEDGLVSYIRNRRFAVIVMTLKVDTQYDSYWAEFCTPRILAAINGNYRLETSLDMPTPERLGHLSRYYIYVPRPGVTNSASQVPISSIPSCNPNKGWRRSPRAGRDRYKLYLSLLGLEARDGDVHDG